MKKNALLVLFSMLLMVLALSVPASSEEKKPVDGADSVKKTVFEDDRKAHAVYDSMIKAIRDLKSLSYECDYRWEAKGKELGHCTYRMWLEKPNYVKMEARTDGKPTGTLIGDGSTFWIFWPDKRPRWSFEDDEDYEKTSTKRYMKKSAPQGKHSLGHQLQLVAAGCSMPILDPSVFHGYTDSLQPHLDGVRAVGKEKVDGVDCTIIEASYINHQRSQLYWVSDRDFLPLRQKSIIRVKYEIVIEEHWKSIEKNTDIPKDMFAWAPPEGWKEWDFPTLEEGLIKAGKEAPDFELPTLGGKTFKLSDQRGKLTWLIFWRVG